MYIECGNYKVTRFCCTSGMCIDCRAVANGGQRRRVVHMDRVSEESAKWVAGNWQSYDAKVEPMTDAELQRAWALY